MLLVQSRWSKYPTYFHLMPFCYEYLAIYYANIIGCMDLSDGFTRIHFKSGLSLLASFDHIYVEKNPPYVCWGIWKERNNSIFREMKKKEVIMCNIIIRFIKEIWEIVKERCLMPPTYKWTCCGFTMHTPLCLEMGTPYFIFLRFLDP